VQKTNQKNETAVNFVKKRTKNRSFLQNEPKTKQKSFLPIAHP